jgi:hypothetical protein
MINILLVMQDEFSPYRKQVNHALRELAEWGKRRKEADKQMAKLRSLIVANANMLPDHERDQLIAMSAEASTFGITNSIRSIFRDAYPKGLTPTQVRDKLIEDGFDLSTQTNPMASIHSVIKRLLTADDIAPFEDGYRWEGKTLAQKAAEYKMEPPPKMGD